MDPRLLSYGIGLSVFLLDRLTKWWIQAQVPIWETLVVIPGFFNIVHTQNPGAAFSVLAGANPAWRGFVLVGIAGAALILVAGLLWKLKEPSKMLLLGLAFIFGGALGNLYDRLAYGAVVDFLEFYVKSFYWPAFNVADTAISTGAALVIFDMWRAGRQAPQRT